MAKIPIYCEISSIDFEIWIKFQYIPERKKERMEKMDLYFVIGE